MKKALLLIALTLGITVGALAQNVGVGTKTPNANAILDVTSTAKGLLLPRLALTATTNFFPLTAHVAGMTVYNTATANDVTPGFYYNDGTKWWRMLPEKPGTPANWFYMPSVTIPLNVTLNTDQTINLYTAYTGQFTNFTGARAALKNTSAPINIPIVPAANQLNYYVTDYDASVLSITSISDAGLMTYRVLKNTADACSYINIVFVLK